MKNNLNKKSWWELYTFDYELIGYLKDTMENVEKIRMRIYFGQIEIWKYSGKTPPKLNYSLNLNNHLVGQFLEKKVAERFHREIHKDMIKKIVENEKLK